MSRSLASAKKAGATFEREVADYLKNTLSDDRIDCRVKTGAKDKGDIGGLRTADGYRIVMECKNVSRDNLPAWIREAETERDNDGALVGVVCHKKHGSGNPGEQYVTLTLKAFATLLIDKPRFDTYVDGYTS